MLRRKYRSSSYRSSNTVMDSSSCWATVVLIISTLLQVANCIDSGSVIFIDSHYSRYLQPYHHKVSEVDPYSQTEVGAAVSVLLGFNPPQSLSVSSSNKLNELLAPNPFDRPRAVFALEVSGVSDHSYTFLDETMIKKPLIDLNETQIQLPGEEINVVSLDADYTNTYTDEEIREFVTWLGGSHNQASDTFDGELLFPLRSGKTLKLQMSEEADRIFALNLISLSNAIQTTSYGTQRPSELITGSFNALTILHNRYGSGDVVNGGLEVLLQTLLKSFGTMKTAYKNGIVGVVFLKSGEEKLMNVVLTSHGSTRILSESDVSKNITDKQRELARRTLTWVTAIILLVSSYIGIYLLMSMPLTKDTLLYSNVKLD